MGETLHLLWGTDLSCEVFAGAPCCDGSPTTQNTGGLCAFTFSSALSYRRLKQATFDSKR